ncbi:MAG: RedB protein [Candidatus Melainabacteria bacterium]|nr:MAG: RedB protein [Candidatus Melainabacteria bacterium]
MNFKNGETNRTLIISMSIWALLVIVSYCGLNAYSTEHGEKGESEMVHWPTISKLERDENKFNLVAFIHPHCPCSRASLNELCKIMSRAKKNVSCRVVFMKPQEFGLDWEKTDLWYTAKQIPNCDCFADINGDETNAFFAKTSGQTYLFDRDGVLIFSGGITGSRGHEGDNPGQLAIEDLALSKKNNNNCSPVFGCPLFDTSKLTWSAKIERN